MREVARSIDLNADLGEGLGADEALLGIVTSANVACGFHAGDDATMRAACTAAVERRVAIGAHVSYRDRDGFGRRELGLAASTVDAEVTEQILALAAIAATAGGRVAYVKPHGALYHRAAVDAECAGAIISAIGAVGGSLAVLALPGSQLLARAHMAGLDAVPEAFADRAYAPDGSLVPRGEPGAVLDADGAVAQALSIARDGLQARSICVHGDTPGAAAIARLVRRGLEDAGIDVRSFA